MKIGVQHIDLSRPVVMTIVNVTPDSFFAGSRTFDRQQVAERAREAVAQGASILDVGGYSSRPGADDVSPQQELDRVLRGVEVVREIYPDVPVSIDTFRSSVARGVIDRLGACMINDISGGELDPEIIGVAAECGVPYIAMHMRGTPVDMQTMTSYDDIVAQVRDYFERKLEVLHGEGVQDIIFDPGFGFAKTVRQNYDLLRGLPQLMVDDVPLLVGVSRKSMIYKVLECEPSDALNGTTALHWESLRGGARILRVHDTAAAAEVIKLYNYYEGDD